MMIEKDELKSNFFNLIGHDIKTPLARIQLICNELMAEDLPPHHMENIKSLHRESHTLHRQMNLALRFSQLDDLQVCKDAADINEVIEDIIKQLGILSKEKGVAIQQNLKPIFLVELDSVLIGEVVSNIIGNAIKYSKAGENIWVTTTEQSGQVEIKVIDEGVGMNSEDTRRAFEKFYRSPKHMSHTSGFGLGLYLAT